MKTYSDISFFFKKLFDLIFINNPAGTSLGVLLGVILHSFLQIFEPLFESVDFLRPFEHLTFFLFVAIGIFSFNIGPYLNKKKLSKKILEEIEMIEAQERKGAISKEEAKYEYRKLVQRVMKDVKLAKPNVTVRGDRRNV